MEFERHKFPCQRAYILQNVLKVISPTGLELKKKRKTFKLMTLKIKSKKHILFGFKFDVLTSLVDLHTNADNDVTKVSSFVQK